MRKPNKPITFAEFSVRIILLNLCGIAIGLQAGCENVHTNLALINSRSPAINAQGTNSVEAADGYTGGGTVAPQIPLK